MSEPIITNTETNAIPAGRIIALALIMLALAIIVCATLFVPWPDDQIGSRYAPLVPHWQRAFNGDMVTIASEIPDPTPQWLINGLWLARRMIDMLHYLLMVTIGGCMVWAFRQNRRLPWYGLLIASLIGTLYSGGMALYNAPLIATPAYLIIFWSAIFTLLAWD